MNLDDLQIIHNEDETRFEADLGDALAVAEYIKAPGKIIFTHTEVPQKYEGQGVGDKLVRSALDQVRDMDLAVIPLCPFVKAFIARHPEYQDLVRV